MICLIASSFPKADKFASTQNFDRSEWFYAENEASLLSRQNFHVIVVDNEFDVFQAKRFESIYFLAKKRGAIGRSQ